jgi:two-component system response regulator FixJ
MSDRQKIYIVDDDAVIRHSLYALLTDANFYVKTFASASDFLLDGARKEGCLIVDVRMPGINWLEFQLELAKQKHDLVILVISGHGDIPMVIGALRAGAIDFIEKPFEREQIITAVRRALDIRASIHDQKAEMEDARQKLATLTARERTVAGELAEGLSNKEAASRLRISPRTVELHRANIMKKLKITSISHLVRLMLAAEGCGGQGGLDVPPVRSARETGLTVIAGGKSRD